MGSLARLPGSAAFSYAAVAAVQLYVLRDVRRRDLTFGDSSFYFLNADRWLTQRRLDIVWSPAYSAALGEMVRGLGDAITATTAMRVVSVTALACCVLAVARRFLRPWSALAVALWWAHVPTVYDASYEVHLFAAVPPLLAVAVAAGRPSAARRGATLALLFVAACLVRNELASALVVAAVAYGWGEWRQGIRDRRREVLVGYGLPLAVGFAVVLGAVALSVQGFGGVRDALDDKQRFNLCQIYAFNAQQREGFGGNAFAECARVMEGDFGSPDPRFGAALVENPGAMARYMRFNARLLVPGLQLGLLGAASGEDNPDYRPVRLGEKWVAPASAALSLVAAFGVVQAWRGRRTNGLLTTRRDGVVAVAALAVSMAVVAITARPRPSFILPLCALAVVAVGLGADHLARRMRCERAASAAVPAAVVVLLLLAPSHFASGPRPLGDGYRRLRPHAALLEGHDVVLVASGYSQELCNYVAPRDPCAGRDWVDVVTEDVGRSLDEAGAGVVYLEDASLMAGTEELGWRPVAGSRDDFGWGIFVRADSTP